MSKAAPWSIKGVDFDAREAAREAAHRQGMTLGEWLNDVIADRAAELGASPEDFDDDDRLGAVSQRLARMRDGAERTRRRSDRRPLRARDDDMDEEDFEPRPRRRALSRNARSREVSWRNGGDAEALLESAIDAFERRASRSQEKTARALADVANLIESTHSRSAREGAALKEIARRLDDIEEQVSREPDAEAYTPIRGALGRLESRLENLSKRGHERDHAGLRDIEGKLAEIAGHLDRKGEGGGAGESDRLARIEEKISQLAAQVDGAPQRKPAQSATVTSLQTRRPLVDAVSQIAQRQRELDGELPFAFGPRRAEARPPFDVRRPPSELETRLSTLLERLEKRAGAEEQAAPQTQMLAGLQGDIARMSSHLERMREDIAQQRSAPASDQSLEGLRREISAVSRGLGELAPRASVASLERTMRELTDRLETMRFDGVREAVIAPVEQLTREIRASLRDLDPRGAIGALEQEMRAIAAKVDSLETRGGADPQTIRAIYDQTREVRDLLSRAASAAMPGERAQRELTELADRLDRSAQGGVPQADFARIVSDIRAVVAEGAGGEGMRALERRIEQLSTRIDAALSGGSDTTQMAAFGDRLDKLQRAVAQTLAAPRSAPAADTHHLEQLVRDLSDKVERAAEPGAGRAELAALQSQIERLSSRIERSNGQDESIASLERMISDLFGQLNETRDAAYQAAERAARSAAQDTLREALASAPALAGGPDLTRDLADLRSIHDRSEQRTHATLKAVHETLERVVDRLATLEDDIAGARRAPAPDLDSLQPSLAAAPVAPVVEAPVESAAPKGKGGASSSVAAALARLKQPAPAVEPQRKAEPAAARKPEPAASAGDHDVLIEPGAGRGRRSPAAAPAAAAPVADAIDRSTQAGFIAAARRAALAAQAASAAADTVSEEQEQEDKKAGGPLAQVKDLYERRRKPLLLTLAALIGLLGALQIGKVYLDGAGMPEAPPPVVRSAPAPAPQSKIDVAPKADASEPAPAARIEAPAKLADEPKPGPRADAAPPAMIGQPASPSAPAVAPRRIEMPPAPAAPAQPRADAGAVDPAPVGAIGKPADEAPPLTVLQTIAAQGDAAAQYELGARYADGVQTARDPKLAAQWFEKSATKGLAPAQYRLGVLYERGLGVQRDLALAKLWYLRAAERGNIRAMHNLAVVVADGGGKPDYTEAARWFRKAAEHGVRDSQYNLAILYARGMGGPQDLAQSYAWFAAAAAQGDEDAGRKRDEVAGRLDAKTLARAKELAAAYRPASADRAANEVSAPPGGWQAPPAKDKPQAKSTARPKMTGL